MLDFSFSEFFSFVLALVGMILSYRRSYKNDRKEEIEHDTQIKK